MGSQKKYWKQQNCNIAVTSKFFVYHNWVNYLCKVLCSTFPCANLYIVDWGCRCEVGTSVHLTTALCSKCTGISIRVPTGQGKLVKVKGIWLVRENAKLPGNTHIHVSWPLVWVSRYQKGKTNLDFTEARDTEWQWHHIRTPPLTFYTPDALPAS